MSKVYPPEYDNPEVDVIVDFCEKCRKYQDGECNGEHICGALYKRLERAFPQDDF